MPAVGDAAELTDAEIAEIDAALADCESTEKTLDVAKRYIAGLEKYVEQLERGRGYARGVGPWLFLGGCIVGFLSATALLSLLN